MPKKNGINREEFEQELTKRERSYRAELAMKILHGQPLTREEYYDALKYKHLLTEGKAVATYEYFSLKFYKDDIMTGWINTNHEEYLDSLSLEKERRDVFGNFGIFPSKLKKEYLSDAQIEFIKKHGFSDEEIGCEVEN
jgi:hypothetical protein